MGKNHDIGIPQARDNCRADRRPKALDRRGGNDLAPAGPYNASVKTDSSTSGFLECIGQMMIDGEEYEFQAVGNSQLVKDVGKVMLDDRLADGKFLGYFLVRIAALD